MRAMLRRVVIISTVVVVVVLAAVGLTGHWLFAGAKDDERQLADAVVVLGGEHDGREAYGVALARQVRASYVLLSDPYPPDDPVMAGFCGKTVDGIDVICRRPIPATTRGEAIMARQLGREYQWDRIAVVTWRYHLPRARLIFRQCYSDASWKTSMYAVPRSYDMSIAFWEYIYLYQYGALVKNTFQSRCADVQ